MSPGVNDGPRNTGTLPKSNRRSDRNRERSAANQQIANRSPYHGHAQHTNNLLQLDWQPVSDRESSRSAKNSNTRSVASAPSTSYQDIPEFAAHNSGRHYNYSIEESSWQKMVPPTDSQSQSPPRLQGTKPTNVDKMPDRSQVESRLNQIRDYIRVTSTMMDSLNQSSDPRAQAQNEKLSTMVEDLHDSERKLSKLLEQYHNRGIPDESDDRAEQRSVQMKQFSGLADVLSLQEQFLSSVSNRRNGESGREDGDENGEAGREMQLRRKMEESQRKLAQLQEHQANLVGMQLCVRERLNKARQAQQALLQHENPNTATVSGWESGGHAPPPLAANVEQLESETAVLRGKLAQLQSKKKHMDHIVAELQAVELSDRASCSSDGSRNVGKDRAAELEAMKAQLAHLKALMEEATRVRECLDSTSEPEPDADVSGEAAEDAEACEEESGANVSGNLFDRQHDSDETSYGKMRNSGERPTVEDVQAVTRELKEQSALLQAARAELHRLKQPLMSQAVHSASASMYSASTPPPSLVGSFASEKKQSNNVNEEAQTIQVKKRQLEDLMRKEQSQASSVNRDVGGHDANSQRGSSSQISHSSTPANIWPHSTAVGGSNEQSMDGISSADNLLDIGPHTGAIENGFNGNWWGYPSPPVNQLQHDSIAVGSAEYYRQLLMGSQAQQLQMMGTTIQQCCQLLWAQQRELQSMRAAISQLQLQLRQSQATQRASNVENQEEYSNLSRNVHHLADTLDAALPPSSSLPNLVSLPNASSALSYTPVVTSANPQQQQQQQQQLNNQVPPGNRANNYWDNFRSYSRQNLLSGNVKTVTDASSGAMANSVSSGNAASGGVNSSIMKDKRNREQGSEHLPLPSLGGAEAQYSLNLQLQSNLQQQERENTAGRSNIITNGASQAQADNIWEEAHASFRLPSSTNDDQPLHRLNPEMKEVLSSLVAANRRRPDYLVIILREIKTISEDHRLRPHLLRSLRALQDTRSARNPLNETTDQTPSESCQSSDDDSDVEVMLSFNLENQSSLTELVAASHSATVSSMAVQDPLLDPLEVPAPFSLDGASALPVAGMLKPGYNEDLAEADQSRPESSGAQQASPPEEENEDGQEAASYAAMSQSTFAIEMDLEGAAAEAEDERAEDTILDRIPTRLYHHH